MIDEEQQYVVVTLSQVTSRKMTPSINLHDFSVGFSAIKNVEKGTCYIEKTRHTMSQMKSEVERAEKATKLESFMKFTFLSLSIDSGYYEVQQWFTCTSKKFIQKSTMSEYGERLAAFCEDYESIFTERTYTKRSRRSLYMVEFAVGCFLCFGTCA